jgi:CTP:molybdopterin cytidylyltransferase MocA
VIAGIILAAGASRRMGTPKALLEYRGETFVARLVRMLAGVCDPVIVVLGHDAGTIRPHVPPTARVAVNPDPTRGQLSSLQTGLAAVPPDAEGFLFVPVDCPAVEQATVERLARAFTRRGSSILLVIPRHGDERGHPVFAARTIAAELLALPPTARAKEVIRGHKTQTLYLDVEDAGVLSDVDDPEAYQRLTVSPA